MDTIYGSLERVHDALYSFRGVDVYRIEDWRIHLRRYGERYVMLSIGTGEEGVEWSDLFSCLYTGYTDKVLEWSRKRVELLAKESRMMRALGYREKSPVYWVREGVDEYLTSGRVRWKVFVSRYRGELDESRIGEIDSQIDSIDYSTERRVWRCVIESEKRWATLEGLQSMSPVLRECIVNAKYLKRLEMEKR